MEKMYKEIRLSGSGGQGLITAGIILANAACIEGINVTQTQSYGAASRGGASRADVIVSSEDIYYPEAQYFDILLCLTQESCDKFVSNLKEGGSLIIDTTFVKNYPVVQADVYDLPFTQIASDKLGSVLPTNILSLAFTVRTSKVVSESALKEAIIKSMKPAYLDLNLNAMKLGFKLADSFLEVE
ncbi:MAG: 2-oxoacid:acceptor oxidoreductase family protein [Candidatus Cloacimonetes bacterium]|nr:2-oxoacid:acceptor oxidoreductase family protein [Candidatus Cloacimonadota bacterium]